MADEVGRRRLVVASPRRPFDRTGAHCFAAPRERGSGTGQVGRIFIDGGEFLIIGIATKGSSLRAPRRSVRGISLERSRPLFGGSPALRARRAPCAAFLNRAGSPFPAAISSFGIWQVSHPDRTDPGPCG